MSIKPPFRADVVGSYLRPDYLHAARRAFAAGDISQAQLSEVEDQAITELVHKQKAMGLAVITDGEFRRSWWHIDFMWGLGGTEKVGIEEGYNFNNMKARAETARLAGKITGQNHPFIEHFKFLLQFAEEGVVPRLTIPAPAQFLKELERAPNIAQTQAIYPDREALIQDIVQAYQQVIEDVYAAGCRNLQLDDCTWGMLTDPKFQKTAGQLVDTCECGDVHDESVASDLQAILDNNIRINNLAIANAPADLVLTTHVCRGNFRSTWAASGGYQPVSKVLFGQSDVDAFYLEFDSERAGDFTPLQNLASGKKVVLGLISSKTPELENPTEVIARIKEASQYVPLENLYLSTQCGFASTEEGNDMTHEQQWAKIKLVQDVAQQVWS